MTAMQYRRLLLPMQAALSDSGRFETFNSRWTRGD
jgi:hypothetical protein